MPAIPASPTDICSNLRPVRNWLISSPETVSACAVTAVGLPWSPLVCATSNLLVEWTPTPLSFHSSYSIQFSHCTKHSVHIMFQLSPRGIRWRCAFCHFPQRDSEANISLCEKKNGLHLFLNRFIDFFGLLTFCTVGHMNHCFFSLIKNLNKMGKAVPQMQTSKVLEMDSNCALRDVLTAAEE